MAKVAVPPPDVPRNPGADRLRCARRHPSMNGLWDQMRQSTPPEVRVDEGKATGSSTSMRSIGCFGRLRRRRRPIAVAKELQKNDPGLNFLGNPGSAGWYCHFG